MEENYTVYKHVNKNNGKVYIGITSGDVQTRWHYGHGYKQNKHFWAAIQKYGWSGFDHIIIRDGLTKEAACIAERKLVKHYDTRNPEHGYNILCGGDIGPRGRTQTEEEKERRRQASIRAWSDPELRAEQSQRLKGRKKSEETIAKMREAGKRKAPPSEDQKKLISASLKEFFSDPDNRKRLSDKKTKHGVICLDTGVEYKNSREASDMTGICQGNIHACCRGERKKAGGLHWAFTDPIAS